jgi:hypothetical protein
MFSYGPLAVFYVLEIAGLSKAAVRKSKATMT